jgi:hypothetical protein
MKLEPGDNNITVPDRVYKPLPVEGLRIARP